jgi:hypothetical protein
VVDSSKIGIRLKYLLRNPGLDVRVIRDSRRAVALTYTDPANSPTLPRPICAAAETARAASASAVALDAAHERRRSNEEAAAIVPA